MKSFLLGPFFHSAAVTKRVYSCPSDQNTSQAHHQLKRHFQAGRSVVMAV